MCVLELRWSSQYGEYDRSWRVRGLKSDSGKSFLVNKTNGCTEFHFYWYYESTCFGQSFCPSSGVLSRTSALVHFMQL